MKRYQMDFELRNRKFRVWVEKKAPCYHLENVDDYGVGREIPCWTDAEERKYPKDAAWVATAFLYGIRQAKKIKIQ